MRATRKSRRGRRSLAKMTKRVKSRRTRSSKRRSKRSSKRNTRGKRGGGEIEDIQKLISELESKLDELDNDADDEGSYNMPNPDRDELVFNIKGLKESLRTLMPHGAAPAWGVAVDDDTISSRKREEILYNQKHKERELDALNSKIVALNSNIYDAKSYNNNDAEIKPLEEQLKKVQEEYDCVSNNGEWNFTHCLPVK